MEKIGIFCSAAANIDKMYFESARQIGEWMGKTGKTLIYGGADLGLMECVARAVKENGGKVIGVVPTKLEEKGRVCTFLDEVIHTHNLSDRKDIMTEKSDIRFLCHDIFPVTKVVGVDHFIKERADTSFLFQFGRNYPDYFAAVFLHGTRYAFHKSEIGSSINQRFTCFTHPLADLAGTFKVHFVNVCGGRTEYSYLFHIRCYCYSPQISAIFYKQQ